MSIADAVFLITAFITIFAALGVVTFPNIIHSALSLVLTFLGVAALYFQLNAGFLGLVQIMVYAGAISVLVIFAVMLVMESDIDKTNLFNNKNLIAGLLITVLTTGTIGLSIVGSHWRVVYDNAEESVGRLAELLMGDYVIGFEIAAILLLVAVVGAIILAKGADSKK